MILNFSNKCWVSFCATQATFSAFKEYIMMLFVFKSAHVPYNWIDVLIFAHTFVGIDQDNTCTNYQRKRPPSVGAPESF